MRPLIATILNRQAAFAYGWGRYVYGIPDGRSEVIDPALVRSLLIVRLDEIGDFVMFTSALRDIRALFPNARITLVVNNLVVNLIEPCPYADVKLGFDIGVRRALRPLVLSLRAMLFATSLAARTPFDLAILPRWGTDAYYATYVAYFSRARWRVGFSENSEPSKRIVNCGFDRLLTHAIYDVTVRHQVEYNYELVKYLGGPAQAGDPELWLTGPDREFAAGVLSENGVAATDRLVAVCPSAGHSVLKQWPLERFADVVARIAAMDGTRVLVVGGPGDEAAARAIIGSLPAIDMTGHTTLRQMAALLELSAVFLGNDVGPMHIATAVGTPVVAIFGASCRHLYGPRGRGHRMLFKELPCSPCATGHQRDRCSRCIYDRPACLDAVSVNEVVCAVVEALAKVT